MHDSRLCSSLYALTWPRQLGITIEVRNVSQMFFFFMYYKFGSNAIVSLHNYNTSQIQLPTFIENIRKLYIYFSFQVFSEEIKEIIQTVHDECVGKTGVAEGERSKENFLPPLFYVSMRMTPSNRRG